MEYNAGSCDVAVIGGGHAGIEAALSSARLGCKTVLFTLSLDSVANMPCNPSIGGTAKGHLVREIDALGGEMGRAADKTTLQSRMLNLSKGPAVRCLRAQVDRDAYRRLMKSVLEKQQNLYLRQGEIVDIRLDKSGRVCAVVTDMGGVFAVKAAIIATGTYLNAKTFTGEAVRKSGPDGLQSADRLTECLKGLGLPLRRFKTGTPARIYAGSIDFDLLEPQRGDEPVVPFSYETADKIENRILCHIAYTNEETHRIIRESLGRSPLFTGMMEGTGARYCPSLEDKVVRFADKERHQLFIEPMGLDTAEMYIQGASSSLPEEVQLSFYRSVRGLSRAQIMRTAYAIEYDCVDPLSLLPDLQFSFLPGLFGAGQFNGTSGYEEAAAQGLIAGINAARFVRGLEPFTLTRDSSYIGAMIDDLTTRGCTDPYRVMTSRSEYRLLLRHDNADERLTPLGYELGLISENRMERFRKKWQRIEDELRRVKAVNLPPTPLLNGIIVSRGTSPIATGTKLYELIRRPQLGYDILRPADVGRPEDITPEIAEAVEIRIKYEGYIARQAEQVEKTRRMESLTLPKDIDYEKLLCLRLEAREKLKAARPMTFGQASRIPGVSPADISALMVYLSARRE
ncbi:MAG: tRNA uridine-5-carboxymethylaminomethyl(34) synthesis enzyme MnmG [Oscillospiraceae bacterium]|jgi:tRNA uridine 5-carboxymethylaminomethyl modification enzyme|nr:tRNA uridine-5-carboxymethylaminomethyl(34) synthesis enzyme MnmG [Oscillospiraceae bacterium]